MWMSTIYQYQEDSRRLQDQSFKKKVFILVGLLLLLCILFIAAILLGSGGSSSMKQLNQSADQFLQALDDRNLDEVKRLSAINSPLRDYSEQTFNLALDTEGIDYGACKIAKEKPVVLKENVPSGTVKALCEQKELNINMIYESSSWKVGIVT